MQDLNDKVTNDPLTAAEWNEPASELQNIIESAGITLSGAALDQALIALTEICSTRDYYLVGGTGDAITLSVVSGSEAPTRLRSGLRVRWTIGDANTGAATINVAGLGVTPLIDIQEFVLVAGQLVAGQEAEATYDSGASSFKLAIPSPATTTEKGLIELAIQAEVNTGTDPGKAVAPSTLAGRLALLGSDDITNESAVTGTTVSDALETVEAAIPTGSDDITNESTVTGTTVSDALETVAAAIPAGSDDITNESTVTGTTVSDALETLEAAIPTASNDLVVIKSSDETRASTTTLADDSDLVLSSVAAGLWAFEASILMATAGALPDFKFRMGNIVNTGTYMYTVTVNQVGSSFVSPTSAGSQDSQGSDNVIAIGAAAGRIINLKGLLEVSATADVAFTWAQNVSNVLGTTVREGSWIRLTQP